MTEVIMPQVGQDIPSAIIVEWLKQESAAVSKGDVIATVESDKASFEVEADTDGVLLKILHDAGEEVEVFKPIAYIGAKDETLESIPAADTATATRPGTAAAPPTAAPPTAPATAPGRMTASPAARRRAAEQGVELGAITGSGPGGRIINRDLAQSATAIAQPADNDDVRPFSRLRRRIAQRLTASKQTIPHFYLFIDVDMTTTETWRRAWRQEHGLKITATHVVTRAAAMALRDFPGINAHVDAEKLIVKPDINIGLAVSVDDGLLVPVLDKADQRSLQEIVTGSTEIAGAARRGTVDPSHSGTFTITSLGMYGISKFMPIINPPECAILAIGAVEKRAVPVNDAVAVREMMTLTLAADHRGVDGAVAAQFLNRLKALLEEFDHD
ncbi:MAG: dihydrolipoamide acetyltransferase family protein [Lentisphaeria bacterium]|jgi:pyruvate dehydrogenase E2 component (dihydrolipoamide acetyltransferase)|nr:dihydrolipoamide acetyltransferase family protein [Lentisphaeria bacterium]MDP7743153.1 dihydrolipoamide acetyltransferase family protein [Lentisphaeria bacterium]